MEDYTIIESSESMKDLIKQVKEYMENGWTVLGAPRVYPEDIGDYIIKGFYCYQAMTRKVKY